MLFQLYKSPFQSHIWVELSPHSYLFTFWAWSNIVAFWEMSWSSSTLVIHHAHSSIKSIKSGSSEALHPPEKKRKEKKREASEETLLLEQKKRTKGKDGEGKVKHHWKGHSSLAHICTWPSSKDDMISQRQDLWSCKINEDICNFIPTLSHTKAFPNVGVVFSKDLSEVQTQNERLRVGWKRWEHASYFWKSCKTSKYREKEVNHVLHRVVLGINIRRRRCYPPRIQGMRKV